MKIVGYIRATSLRSMIKVGLRLLIGSRISSSSRRESTLLLRGWRIFIPFVRCEFRASFVGFCRRLTSRGCSVAQILVHGDSLQDCVVAIVVVDPITFAPFASKVLKQELDVSSLSTVLTNPQLVAALAQELQKFGTAAKVNG